MTLRVGEFGRGQRTGSMKGCVAMAALVLGAGSMLSACESMSRSDGGDSGAKVEDHMMGGSLVAANQKAPSFNLVDQSGMTHNLEKYSGQWVVLYFYPKDDTPGCTTQACSFRDSLPRFDEIEAFVLGVSPDDADSHAKFATKHDLEFALLADTERTDDGAPVVCHKYGVWQEKTIFGNKHMGVVRTTYIINPEGEIAHRFDKVKPDGHASEVFDWLQTNAISG